MEEQNKNLFQEDTTQEPGKASSDPGTTPTSEPETTGHGGASKTWGYILAIILIILVILAIIFFASPKSRIPAPTTQTGQAASSQVTTSSQATGTEAEAGTAAPSSLCKTIKSITSTRSPALIIAESTGANTYTFFVYHFNSRTGAIGELAISPQTISTLELFTINGVEKRGHKLGADFELPDGVYAWTVAGDEGDLSETYECFRIGDLEGEAVGLEEGIDLAAVTETTLIAQTSAGNFWAWLIGTSTSWSEVSKENVSGLAKKAQGKAAIEDIRDRCGDADGSILVAVTPEGLTCNDLSGTTGWRSI